MLNARRILVASAFIGAIAAIHQPLQAADYTAFSMMVPCSVKTVGLGLTGNVTKFPVLVRVGPSVMNNVARTASGNDVRFSKSGASKTNLAPLPFQKERWNVSGANSAAEFWVLVDTVYANNNSHQIYLHYGNNSLPDNDSSQPETVFSTSNGFTGVWHLAETGNGQRMDATANNCDLDANGYDGSESVAGLIGNGDNTGLTGKHLYKNNPSPAQMTGSAITVSCWVGNWDTTLAQAHLLTKYNWGAPSTSYKILGWNKTAIGEVVTTVGTKTTYLNGLVQGVWNHITMTYDGANMYVYANGTASAANPHTGTIVDCTEPFRFRYQSDGNGLCNPYGGLMDEARLESVARSPDWVKLCYENQRPGSPVVRLGAASGTPPEPGDISAAPADTTVRAGTSVTFRTTCTATGPSYAWYKVKTPADSAMGITTANLTLTNVQKSLDGAQYYCKGTSSSGKWTGNSNYVTLHVVSPVVAAIRADTTLGRDSARVTFTDQSTGDITDWQWNFGDGITEDSRTRRSTVAHTYTKPGKYVCRLIVFGSAIAGRDTAWSDTITVFNQSGNPLTMSAQYSSGTRIDITIRGISSVNTAFPPPYASEIGLWFAQTGTIDTAVGKIHRKWAIASMGGGDSFTVSVDVPAPTLPEHAQYHFWVCPLWNTGLNSYNAGNGADVIMRPVNRFVLSPRYLGNKATLPSVDLDPTALDSALVTVVNLAAIDTPAVTRVIMSWGFSPTQMARNDTIAVSAFPGTWGFSSPSFEGDTLQVYVRAEQVSANGMISLPKDTTLVVGWPKPRYLGALTIDTVGPTYATMHWDPPSGAVDSIRIVHCKSPDTISLSTLNPAEVGLSGLRYTAVYAPNSSALTLTVTGLTMETGYWVGLQVKLNGQWSNVTSAARKYFLTKPVDPTAVVTNTARIDSVWFDAPRNAFVVRWGLQLVPAVTLNLGFTYATDQATASTVNPDVSKLSYKLLTVDTTAGETVVSLGDSIRFETLYYVALWLRSAVGPWAAPTAASTDTCRTSKPLWQIVKYFEPGSDVVRAFNGQVLIRNDGKYPTVVGTIIDSLKVFTPTAASLTGFVPAGLGITLQKTPYDSIMLGFAYGTLPYPITPRDVGVYRDSSGVWLAVQGFTLDEASGLIWYKTKNIVEMGRPVPYIIMADTVRPSAVISAADTSDIAEFGTALTDTVVLSDNVRNLSWRLLYATGGDPFVADANNSVGGVACGSCPNGEKIVLTVPARFIDDAVGVRAILVVSDGPHSDTINISRRILRENSDPVPTEEQEWVPLWTTAVLDSPRIADALSELVPAGEAWQYDKAQFRFYRWLPDGSKPMNSNSNWVEYSQTNDSLFNLVPGRVIWAKTRLPQSLGLGSGISVSTKGPYSISLRAGQFTDIAVPFALDVCMGDIMAASGGEADSVEVFAWNSHAVSIDGKNADVRVTDLVFTKLEPDPDKQRLDSVMESKPLRAYSLLNRSSRTVTVRIPPIPASMSSYAGALPKAVTVNSQDWSVKILAQTGEGFPLSTVYCGLRKGSVSTQYAPVSPSFMPVTVGVFDRPRGEVYGRCATISPDATGGAWELAFCNDSDTEQTIRFQVEKCATVPRDYSVRLLGESLGSWSAPTSGQQVRVAAHSRVYRQLAVGNSAFLDRYISSYPSARFGFLGCSPNPFRGRFSLKFSVPALADVQKVRLTLHDSQGRRVWTADLSGGVLPGVNQVTVRPENGGAPLPSGVYVLRMDMVSHGGKSVASFTTRTTAIR